MNQKILDTNYAKSLQFSLIPASLRGYSIKLNSKKNLSVSAICSYLYCPGCAYDIYVKHTHKKENIHSLRGQIYHLVYEWLFAREKEFIAIIKSKKTCKDIFERLDILFSDLEFVLSRNFYTKSITVGMNYESEVCQVKKRIKETITDWIEKYRDNDYEPPSYSKRSFEVLIKGKNIGISYGKIDIVEDGLPIEIKTGYAPKDNALPTHKLQLILYTLLLEHKYEYDVNIGLIYYTKNNNIIPIITDVTIRKWAIQTITNAINVLDDSKVRPLCVCR